MKSFYDFAKHQKSIGYTTFGSIWKSYSKYLINLSFMESFGAFFAKWLVVKMAPKSIKKALGFSLKVDDVLRLCKTSTNIQ